MQLGVVKYFYLFIIFAFALFDFSGLCCASPIRQFDFVVKEASYRRLCKRNNILTVNGQYPGPTLHVHKGEMIIVNVYNHGKHNITIHWHGVIQPRNPWGDGPAYITQCPIQPGQVFKQTVIFSTEEGTLWWHAHSDWARATVHGPIIIYPANGTGYPFPKPYQEVPIILGEWWKSSISEIHKEAIVTGGNPRLSDAFTINGQPGYLYPCSKRDTFSLNVETGKTYLLRVINAALFDILFFAVANHNLTIVGADAAYTKPLTKEYVVVSPGQTLDCLLHANQNPGQYFMAARAYSTGLHVGFDETMTVGILHYNQPQMNNKLSPPLPYLPSYTNITASFDVLGEIRSLADEYHPNLVPMNPTTKMLITLSINLQPCPKNRVCQGPNGTKLEASMNNISFANPSSMDILLAYYRQVKGVFDRDFPSFPPLQFNYTADYQPLSLEATRKETSVKFLEYNSEVELVFQGTTVVTGIDHPMHLHGYSVYVVGWGFGNFDEEKDPSKYNLVDPPLRNTIVVPKNGWAAVRFKANNPGVWFMHCHFERHQLWGMDTTFIVSDGRDDKEKMLPPPPDMPPC